MIKLITLALLAYVVYTIHTNLKQACEEYRTLVTNVNAVTSKAVAVGKKAYKKAVND